GIPSSFCPPYWMERGPGGRQRQTAPLAPRLRTHGILAMSLWSSRCLGRLPPRIFKHQSTSTVRRALPPHPGPLPEGEGRGEGELSVELKLTYENRYACKVHASGRTRTSEKISTFTDEIF